MGLPWLQVSTDVFAKAGPLAALLKVDEDKALAMLLRLWHYVVESAPENAPPSGLLDAQDGPILIAGACRWVADADALVRALKRVGFIEDMGAELRIRGTSRYAAIWKKNRKPYGVRPETGGKPNGSRTEEGDEEEDVDREPTTSSSEVASSPSREAGPLPTVRAAVPLPDMPENRFASGQAFFAWVQHERHRAGFATETPPANLGRWFSEAMMELNGDGPRLEATLGAFVRDPYWRERNCPFPGFVKQWRNFVPRKAAAS